MRPIYRSLKVILCIALSSLLLCFVNSSCLGLPEPHNSVTVSDIQSSFTRHTEKVANFIHNEEKKTVNTDPEMTQTIELNKDLKRLIEIDATYSRK